MSNPGLKPFQLKKPSKRLPKARKPIARSQRPIRKRTSKRAAEEARYRKRSKQWLFPSDGAFRFCEGHHERLLPPVIANQVHHKFGRRGRLLNYEPFWIAVCNDCQDWIHNREPDKARELGLLCPKGQYNNQSLAK